MKLDDMQKLAKFVPTHTPADKIKMHEFLLSLGIDPENLYQELEMSSLYVNTHRDTSYASMPIALHSHDYYEILYCRAAEDVEYLLGADRYRLQTGDIIFVPPGVPHRPFMPEQSAQPYIRDVIWVSELFMNGAKKVFPESETYATMLTLPIRTSGSKRERMSALFAVGVYEEENKRPGWDAVVVGNTLTILAQLHRLLSEHSVGPMRAEKSELLDRITAYIESNYAAHITLSDLARRFYVSESSISHSFKRKMGVSVYRYVTQRRLIAAKTLIGKNLPLESVAEQIGFTDYSTFYRAFKQEFGISPKKYQKMQP